MLGDVVEWVSEDLFGSKSQSPDADLVMRLSEKRLICDECRTEDCFVQAHYHQCGPDQVHTVFTCVNSNETAYSK